MKPKFLRFCGSLALLLLAAALPLWLLWRRAELAREQGAELKSRAAQSALAKDRDKKLSTAQQLAGLEAAPSSLSPDDFLKWETFCQDQPWTALQPVLETRAAQTSGEDEVRNLLLVSRVRIAASEKGIREVDVRDDKVMLTRHGQFLMQGHQFPRLKETQAEKRLKELLYLVANWKLAPATPVK